eukprot:c1979_g1_i1.p1 GENE.c1979_g1_i1~~c1979_g1_i1.p1  ORF type:complete len:124 (-),score=30.44 c1979_g1_i1:53-424(-)
MGKAERIEPQETKQLVQQIKLQLDSASAKFTQLRPNAADETSIAPPVTAFPATRALLDAFAKSLDSHPLFTPPYVDDLEVYQAKTDAFSEATNSEGFVYGYGVTPISNAPQVKDFRSNRTKQK